MQRYEVDVGTFYVIAKSEEDAENIVLNMLELREARPIVKLSKFMAKEA